MKSKTYTRDLAVFINDEKFGEVYFEDGEVVFDPNNDSTFTEETLKQVLKEMKHLKDIS